MNQFTTTVQSFAASEGPHVSINAETVFTVAGFPITNSMLLGALGFVLCFWLLWYVASAIKRGKRNFVVQIVEWVYEGLYGTVRTVIGDEKMTRAIAPIPITLFFFILVQYYLGVLPIVGPLFWDGTHMFRSYLADLNTTFGLAIVTIVVAEVYAFKVHGIFGGINRYLKNPFKDPIGAFEGILEIVAQMSRGIALSMRLFGNVFAGEVLLIMIAFLAQYAAAVALPALYLFEFFIGGIQAYLFFMLTTIFISLGMASHGSHDEHPDSDHSSPDTAQPVPVER
jgi:F-type H+-transporting ATPase subunit a